MVKKAKAKTKTRTQYTAAYKTEALALADKIGVSAAAKELGVHESQLYNWRGKMKQGQSTSAREQQLAAENAKLKRQLADQAEEMAILKKASAYFAKHLK